MYSKAFLLKLENEPVCQKKPDVLKAWNNITRLSVQHSSIGVSSFQMLII